MGKTRSRTMTKPENSTLPPELYYENASQYKNSSRLNFIQSKITNIALDLVLCNESKPLLILDLGCGTGMSGDCISERGHFWIGCDISRDMLLCAQNDDTSDEIESTASDKLMVESDHISDESNTSSDSPSEEIPEKNCSRGQSLSFFHLDVSADLPFGAGTFDVVVSISCIQWLFHNRSIFESRKKIRNMFLNCKAILKLKGKAVFQFYNSKCKEYTDCLLEEAKKAGFFAEFVTSGKGRNIKTFLLLDCHKKRFQKKSLQVKKPHKVLSKISKFKERRLIKGKHAAKDSKYSGRKRSKKFI